MTRCRFAGRRGTSGHHGPHLLALSALLLALIALLAPTTPPAAAQEATEGDTDASGDGDETDLDVTTVADDVQLVVAELSGALGPGTTVLDSTALDPPPVNTPMNDELVLRVLVENEGRSALDRLRLVVQLHDPVDSRAALARVFERGPVGDPRQVVYDEPLRGDGTVGGGHVAGASLRLERAAVDWDGDGVHPLTIAVVRGTDVLSAVHTAVVWLDRPPVEPVLASFVWPLADAPWRGPQGNYTQGPDRAVQPGGRLDVLLRTLERHGEAPVVLAPATHLLEDLRDRAGGYTAIRRQPDGKVESRRIDPEDPPALLARETLQRLRALAASLPYAPVSGVYADADVAGLVHHGGGLTALGAEAAVEGRRRLPSLLERPADAATHLAGTRMSTAVLDLVPGDQILLPAAAVAGDPTAAGALRPLRSAAGRQLTGIVADPHLTDALAAPSSPAGPVVDSQRVLAHTAQLWLQQPAGRPGAALLLPPDAWAPSAELAERLLDDLTGAPWLRLTTPSQQAALVGVDAAPIELAAAPSSLTSAFASSVADASAELGAVTSALPEDSTTLGGREPSDLRDLLLRSTSRWYLDTGGSEGEALVRDVRRTVDETFGDVVVASGSRVTLTSDTGEIPVTLQRTRGGPIAVRVEVASQGRLLWPEGQRSEPLVLTEGAAQTVSFPTRALSTGTFSVAVRVTDPTGTHTLERTTLSVRSAAISGPALAATGGAVLLLLLAGAVRRRRPSRPQLAVVDEPTRAGPT